MEKTKLNAGRKEAEAERRNGAARERLWELYLVSHSHVAIYRLIEMG